MSVRLAAATITKATFLNLISVLRQMRCGDGRHCRLDADLRTLRQITPHEADLENLIVRRGKCVSDSSAGRSLSPSLPCFRAQRPAKPTFRNPGVRTEQETNRGRQFALTVLITNAW